MNQLFGGLINVWAQERWNSCIFWIDLPKPWLRQKIPLDVNSSLSPFKMKHTEEWFWFATKEHRYACFHSYLGWKTFLGDDDCVPIICQTALSLRTVLLECWFTLNSRRQTCCVGESLHQLGRNSSTRDSKPTCEDPIHEASKLNLPMISHSSWQLHQPRSGGGLFDDPLAGAKKAQAGVLEVNGGLRNRGVFLEWQRNYFKQGTETVVCFLKPYWSDHEGVLPSVCKASSPSPAATLFDEEPRQAEKIGYTVILLVLLLVMVQID